MKITAKWLAKLLAKHLPPKREPDFLIGPDKSDPYMRRWFLIPRNRWFNIYLHHIMHDDDDRACHDHPWLSVSLMLRGALNEIVRLGEDDEGIEQLILRPVRAGDIVFRSGSFAHRLTVHPDHRADGVVTLFITGPKFRKWGFYCAKSSPAGGWRPWDEFTDPHDTGSIGRGCGE